MRYATLAALLLVSQPAAARWPTGSTPRLAAAAQTVTEAAGEHGIAPELLGAVLVHETGVQGIRGCCADVWGPGQVARGWVPWLAERGYLSPGDGPEAMLDLDTGIWAAAAVLAYLLRRAPTVALGLCAYAVGNAAAGFERDCSYSRAVMANLGRVRVTLAAGLIMRELCGGGR